MKAKSFLLFLLIMLLVTSFLSFYVPSIEANPDSITFSPRTGASGSGTITVLGYTESRPCNATDLYLADKAGTRTLRSSATYTTNGTMSLTTVVCPADDKALKLDFVVTAITGTVEFFLNGTDKDDNIQTEWVNMSAVQTYTTSQWFKTIKTNGITRYVNTGESVKLYICQNRWGVIWKEGDSFIFNAQIYLGDGMEETWFAETSKQILFKSTCLFPHIYVEEYFDATTHFRLGKLVDASKKLGSEGCQITTERSGARIIQSYGDAKIYASSFLSTGELPASLKFYTDFTLWQSNLDAVMLYVLPYVDANIYRVTVDKTIYGVSYYSSIGTIDDLLIHSCEYGSYLVTIASPTFRNAIFSNNTYLLYLDPYWTGTLYLVNPQFDNWNLLWGSGSTGTVYLQYTFDLTLTYPNGTNFQGANVTLDYYGNGGGYVGSWLTNATGQVPTQTLTKGYGNETSGNSLYTYNPYHVKITNSEYQSKEWNFTLVTQENWNFAMFPEVTNNPVARFKYSPERPYINQTINFNASNSVDPDGGNITSYSWNFGDSNSGNGVTVTHNYTSAGKYLVNLTVTDDEGSTDSTILYVNVTDYLSPIARFTFSPSNPLIQQSIVFYASLSEDPDGTITSYSWKFGDGAVGSGLSVTHSYNATNSYSVNLTVTDNQGKLDSFVQTITVSAPSGSSGITPKAPYFDITFLDTIDYLVYLPLIREKVSISTSLHNKGDFQQEVILGYWLKDEDGEKVWEGEQSLLMQAKETRSLSLTYPIPIEDGVYTVYAQVTYPKGEGASVQQQFQSYTFINWLFSPAGSFVLALIIISIIVVVALVLAYAKREGYI